MPINIHHKNAVEQKNAEMFSYAGDRESLRKRWEMALATGVTLVEEIKIPFPIEKEYKAVKSMYLNNTILNLLATLGSGLAGFGLDSLQEFVNASKDIKTIQDFYVFLAIFGFIGIENHKITIYYNALCGLI